MRKIIIVINTWYNLDLCRLDKPYSISEMGDYSQPDYTYSHDNAGQCFMVCVLSTTGILRSINVAECRHPHTRTYIRDWAW